MEVMMKRNRDLLNDIVMCLRENEPEEKSSNYFTIEQDWISGNAA